MIIRPPESAVFRPAFGMAWQGTQGPSGVKRT